MSLRSISDKIFSHNSHGLEYVVFLFICGLFFTPLLLEVAAALLLVFLLFFIFQKPAPHFTPIHYVILTYCLSAIFAFLVSGQTLDDLPKFLPHFVLLSYLSLSLWLARERDFKTLRWIHWIIACGVLAALVGIVNHFLGKDRTTTTFGGYFTLAALMSWSIPLTIGRFLQVESKKIYYYIFFLLLQLLALWWTFTRSAFLGLFIGFGVWFVTMLFIKKTIKKSSLLKWTIVFSLPMILLLLIFLSSDQRINPIAKADSSSSSTVDLSSGRKGIILDALSILNSDLQQMNFSSLIFGHGLSSYRRLVHSPWASWESDYLEILMSQGILGLIIILLLYFYFLRMIWQGLQSESVLTNSMAISGIIFWIMSFFTLKLVSWHSGGIFLLILLLLEHPPSRTDEMKLNFKK